MASYEVYWDTVSLEKTLFSEREAQGIIKGEAIGQMKEKINIAQKLLAEGFTMDMVLKITGLSESDIR